MSSEPPRRRHSPAVYRRRRIVLIVALLALVAVIWLLIAQPWRGAAAESADPTPSASKASFSEIPVPGTTTPADGEGADAATGAAEAPETSVAPTTAPTAEATPTAKPCVAKDVSVEALADAETYGSGQNPQLSIILTNNGDQDCTINVGTSTQVFTIKSGDDVWWRSTDCQTEPSDMVVTLAAGQSVSSAAPLAWDRTRSAVGSCADPNRQVASGGGASYNLSVEIGGIPSTQATQLLLY